MLIECLLKRKDGSKVPFGKNVLKQVVYHFKPMSQDDESPHVAEVDNKDHANTLLAIRPKAYVPYIEGEGGQFDDEDFEDAEPKGEVDDYSDSVMATIDADKVSAKYVKDFAKNVLNVNANDRKAISEIYAKNTGKTLRNTMTPTAMLRECLREMVKDALEALEIAKVNELSK